MAVLAAVAGLGLGSVASAAVFHDADFTGTRAWDNPDAWVENDVPTSASDIIYINKSIVTASTVPSTGNFTGGEIHISGTGQLQLIGFWATSSIAHVNVRMDGGTLFVGMANTVVRAGGKQLLHVEGVSTLQSGGNWMGNGSTLGGGGDGGWNYRSAQLSGDGTLIILAPDTWMALGSDAAFNAVMANGMTGSTFTGVFDVRQGQLNVQARDFTDKGTVLLNDTSLKLDYQGPVDVKNLYGSGNIRFYDGTNRPMSYLAIVGELNPSGIGADGLADPNTAGQITRSPVFYNASGGVGNQANNSLVFKSGSQLVMDVFSEDPEGADRVVWTDAIGSSVMDFASAELVIQMHFAGTPGTPYSWLLIDGDDFGIVNLTSGAKTLSDIKFLNDDGDNVTFGNNPGWTLSLEYDRTVGSNQVWLHGTYGAIPEPASLGFLGLGAIGLLARRRR